MMSKNALKVFLVAFFLICLGSQPAALSQETTTTIATPASAQPESDVSEQPVPIKTTQIDKAGKSIGEGIEKLGEKASRQLGDWINVKVYAGITWLKLVFCLALIFLVVIIERFLKIFIKSKIDAKAQEPATFKIMFLEALAKPLTLFIWVYGIYAALTPLFSHFEGPGGANLVHTVAQKTAGVGGTVALFWFIVRLVDIFEHWLQKFTQGSENDIDKMLVPIISKTLRVFIIIIGAILVLQNLTGVQIGPLLASLGIGGLAVALAAKDSIANFFGTLTILFDKPFQMGDRIVIDAFDGVVESVGFRSTRIRTLTGHLLSIPNEKIVNSSLENIGKRPHIRWLTNIGITYDTAPDKVEKAVEILREILDNHEGMHPDFPPRVYFNGFNDWSLNILVVVWYHPPAYWDYSAWLQNICLEIMRRFEAEDIDFAFPSRTLYLANDDKRQLKLQMLKGELGRFGSEPAGE